MLEQYEKLCLMAAKECGEKIVRIRKKNESPMG
jgi:hypothetical protein